MSQYEKEKARLGQVFEQMYDQLWTWREAHPEATFDEIASQATPQRRGVMAEVLQALARQHGGGQEAAGQACPDCGGAMVYKGEAKREVEHYLEGETELKRAYYYCPGCERGLFPPG